MEENLRILMAAFEDEKKALEEVIQQYLSEDEFKYAYYHHKALMRLQKNIYTLKVFENPFLDFIEFNEKEVKFWEEHLKNAQLNGYPLDFIVKNLEHHKRQLAKFEEELLQSKQIKKENTIDQAFSELFGNRIKYFIIHLTRQEPLLFKFTFTRKTLQITMPLIKTLRKTWYLKKRNLKALIHLGFTLSKSGNNLKLSIKGDKDQIIAKFKVLFSRIVFDVFYVNEFKNQSAIEFGPPV
jgi:hypothetical protein